MFVGKIIGNRVVGRWCEAPYASARDTGDATLVVKGRGDAARVTGHWRYSGDDEWAGRWALQHAAVAPPPELAARLATDTWRCDEIARP